MAGDGHKLLERELGTVPPAGLDALEDSHLAELAAAVQEAKRSQAEALGRAADRALGHIPRVLRGPVRAVFR
jgi:hypothetical protein